MKELKGIMLKAKEKWYKKGFSLDGFVISGTICGSKEMHENYGPTDKAFNYLIQLLDVSNSEEEVIDKLSRTACVI